jgi:hypothetical protein
VPRAQVKHFVRLAQASFDGPLRNYPRGMFVMGIGTSFDAFIPPYGPEKHKKIEQLFALRRRQLRIGRWLRPGLPRATMTLPLDK